MINLNLRTIRPLLYLMGIALLTLACGTTEYIRRQEDKAEYGPTLRPSTTVTTMPVEVLKQTQSVAVVEDEQLGQHSDAAHCDALVYVDVMVDPAPIEKTNDNGSYWCYLDYIFTNTHPTLNLGLTWKHDDSSLSTGPYWTHPKLAPGKSYTLTMRSDKSADGKWKTVDGDLLMAWFATEACNSYKHEYWPTDSDPDRILISDLTRLELDNPCLP